MQVDHDFAAKAPAIMASGSERSSLQLSLSEAGRTSVARNLLIADARLSVTSTAGALAKTSLQSASPQPDRVTI
jgi:hypothetical protein